MSIKLISWNINMFKPDKPENENDIIRELNSKTDDEHFIFLIESSIPFVKKLMQSDLGKKYKLLKNYTISHGGLINLLFRKDLNKINFIPIEAPVLLIKYNFNGIDIFIGGCHLFPFAENAERRMEELLITRSVVPPKNSLILIGDMNIREKESKFLEKKNNILDLIDSGDKRKTWFSHFFDNKSFNVGMRFDRLFISPSLVIEEFDLFGKSIIFKKVKYLSDHMAIKTKIKI